MSLTQQEFHGKNIKEPFNLLLSDYCYSVRYEICYLTLHNYLGLW